MSSCLVAIGRKSRNTSHKASILLDYEKLPRLEKFRKRRQEIVSLGIAAFKVRDEIELVSDFLSIILFTRTF